MRYHPLILKYVPSICLRTSSAILALLEILLMQYFHKSIKNFLYPFNICSSKHIHAFAIQGAVVKLLIFLVYSPDQIWT